MNDQRSGLISYIHNKPLNVLSEDKLGREHAVNYVMSLVTAETLVGESLFLVAPTGSGRTSTLNFIAQEIVSLENDGQKTKSDSKAPTNILLRFDCSYLNKTGDSFAYLVRRIFKHIVDDPVLRQSLLVEQKNYRYGKREHSVERTFFPDVEDKRIQKVLASHLGENRDVLSLMESLTFINQLTEKSQWVLLIDNYDRLNDSVKKDMRESLERLHGKLHNIVSVIAVDPGGRASFVSRTMVEENVYRIREPLNVPSIVGNYQGIYRNYIRNQIAKAGLVFRDDWVEMLGDYFGDDIYALKMFLNSLLVYPSFDFNNIKPSFFGYLNYKERNQNTRKEEHFSRLGSLLLLKQKFPDYFEEISNKGEAGYLKFLTDVFEPKDEAREEVKFIQSHFKLDGSGYSHPFFRIKDAAPYLTLRFLPRELSWIENKLLNWFDRTTNDGVSFYRELDEEYSNVNARVIEDELERVLVEVGDFEKKKYDKLEHAQLIYWVAEALFTSFEELAKKKKTSAEISNAPHLLEDFHKTLDLAKDLSDSSIKKLNNENDSGSSGIVGLEQDIYLGYLGYLLNQASFLSARIYLARNEFESAKNSIGQINTKLKSFIDNNQFRNTVSNLDAAIDSKKGGESIGGVEKSKYDLFISHRNDPLDVSIAYDIYHSLKKRCGNNIDIYFYKEVNRSGVPWRNELWEALGNSASYLLILSERYLTLKEVEDRENWTHAEAAAARQGNYLRAAPLFWTYIKDEAEADFLKDDYPLFSWLKNYQSPGNIDCIKPEPKRFASKDTKREMERDFKEKLAESVEVISRKIIRELGIPEQNDSSQSE